MGEVSPKIDNDWHDEYDVFISYRRQGGAELETVKRQMRADASRYN